MDEAKHNSFIPKRVKTLRRVIRREQALKRYNSLNSKDLPSFSGQYQAMYKELRKQRKGGLC